MISASSLLCTFLALLSSADAFVPHALATHRTINRRHSRQQVRCSDEDTTPVDRLFACLPYLLPVLDGFGYGAYVYQNVPLAGDLAMGCADTYVPEPPYYTYGLCVPASSILYVPEAQGSLLPGRKGLGDLGVRPYVRRTVAPQAMGLVPAVGAFQVWRAPRARLPAD